MSGSLDLNPRVPDDDISMIYNVPKKGEKRTDDEKEEEKKGKKSK